MASANKSAAMIPFTTTRPAAVIVVCSIFLSFLLRPARPGACTHILRDGDHEPSTLDRIVVARNLARASDSHPPKRGLCSLRPKRDASGPDPSDRSPLLSLVMSARPRRDHRGDLLSVEVDR